MSEPSFMGGASRTTVETVGMNGIRPPVSQSEIATVTAPGLRRPRTPIRVGEKVLLVENERLLRDYLRKMLTAAGYAVLDADNGREAIQLAEANAACIRLLVTDLIMPGMSGAELAEKIQIVRPRLPVIFTSAYMKEAAVTCGVLKANAHYLEKPFRPSQLIQLARAVLIRAADEDAAAT